MVVSCRLFLIVHAVLFLGITTALHGKNLLVSGDNTYGQLGNGLSDYYPEFVSITQNVVSVSAGNDHILFEDTSGNVWLLGLNMVGSTEAAPNLVFGQVYDDPVLVATDATYYEANSNWNFFRFEGDDNLYSSGYPSRGVNGLSNLIPRTTPTIIDSGLQNIVDVSSTSEAAVYLNANGNVYGLGNPFNLGLPLGQSFDPADPLLMEEGILRAEMSANYPAFLHESGELRRYLFNGGGSDDSIGQYEVIDTNVSDFTMQKGSVIYYIDTSSRLYSRASANEQRTHIADNVKTVITRLYNTFYITNNSELWAFGENATGLMGRGGFDGTENPVLIRDGVESMTMNDETLYIVDSNGNLLGAGYNGNSRLGKPLAEAARTPILLTSGDFSKIETGYQTYYYIESNGDLYGFGRNDSGQLGLGNELLLEDPQLIASNIVDVSVGSLSNDGLGTYAAFVNEDDELWGLGARLLSQINSEEINSNSPQLVDTNVKTSRSGDFNLAYLKNDKSLWAFGDSYYSPEMVAENVEKYDIGAVLAYIDFDGNLKKNGSTIDTDVAELAVGWLSVSYIKENGDLYITEKRAPVWEEFEEGPFLLDTDVVRLSHSRYALMYQKSDSSVWLKAGSLDFYPPEFDEVPDEPVEVLDDLIITDFSVGGRNILYLAESTEPPSVESVSSSINKPTHFGQAVDLNARVFGGYSEFSWYAGEVGDRSNPIESSNLRTTVYPNNTTRYWLEVSGPYGTAQSSETIQVEVALPEYANWVMNSGLALENAGYDADPEGDNNPNLLEFFYDLDPFSYNTNPWQVEFNQDNKTISFVLPRINAPGFTLVVQYREDEYSDWLPVADNPSLEITESENSLVVTIRSQNIDGLRLRLKVEID